MLEFQIEGQKLYIKKGTTMQLEMNNSIFNTDNIEGDVIFTFDVPAEQNDLIFEHARYVYVQRKRKYKAFIAINGVVIAEGDLYLQKSTKLSYSCGIVVNPYPSGFAERYLKENEFADDIIISDDTVETLADHHAQFRQFIINSFSDDFPIHFPTIYAEKFYGNSNTSYLKFLNLIQKFGENIILSNNIFMGTFEGQYCTPSTDLNKCSYVACLQLVYLLQSVIKSAGYLLTGNFSEDTSIKKIIFPSLNALDSTLKTGFIRLVCQQLLQPSGAIIENVSSHFSLVDNTIYLIPEENYHDIFQQGDQCYHIQTAGIMYFNVRALIPAKQLYEDFEALDSVILTFYCPDDNNTLFTKAISEITLTDELFVVKFSFALNFYQSDIGKRYKFDLMAQCGNFLVGVCPDMIIESTTTYMQLNAFSKKICLKDHVPDLTNSDFFNTINNTFGLAYYIDSKTKKIELSFIKDILANKNYLDLSPYVLQKETEIEEYDPLTYTLEIQSGIEENEFDENDLLDTVNTILQMPSPYFNLGKIILVERENAYYKCVEEDATSVPTWQVWAPANTKLKVGDVQDKTENISPSVKQLTNTLKNNFFLPNYEGAGISSIFTPEEESKFELILLNWHGWQNSVNNDNTFQYPFASVLNCDMNGNKLSDYKLSAAGEESIGETFVKPWLSFLANCEYLTYQFLLPINKFIEVVNLLKPQEGEVKNKIRWVFVDGLLLLPAQMNFEFTEGKETIKAEIKFAKEKVKI